MKQILIIDDDTNIRTIIGDILSMAGYEPLIAADGDEGLKLLKGNPCPLLITDLIMPEKEGIETIIEAKKSNPEIKVIAISGGGRIGATDYLSVASKIGADATLAKPFRNHELIDLVKNLIGTP